MDKEKDNYGIRQYIVDSLKHYFFKMLSFLGKCPECGSIPPYCGRCWMTKNLHDHEEYEE